MNPAPVERGKPSCPICTGRNCEQVDTPNGKFLCSECVTLFNGDEIEWRLNRERREMRAAWVRNRESERATKLRSVPDTTFEGRPVVDTVDVAEIPDRWRDRADLT